MQERELRLQISGLGIIMYSPSMAAHIAAGEDYLTRHYMTGPQVQAHIQAGSIVGFGTASPGVFVLRFRNGYPEEEYQRSCKYQLRLGLRVVDEAICVRDLYDLMEWNPACPAGQRVDIPSGIFHVTLCSRPPPSGVIGDEQVIDVFLQPLPAMPRLNPVGIPTLVTDD